MAYLSAEFLVGRLVYANLLNMGRLGEVQQMLLDAGVDANAVSYTHLDVYKRQVDRNGTWSAQASNEYMTTILSEYTEANNNMVELVICCLLYTSMVHAFSWILILFQSGLLLFDAFSYLIYIF